MTTQRTFKQRLRARMAQTGESYRAARRMLIAHGDQPEADNAEWLQPVSDGAVLAASGSHWWAQTISVGYERARGLRAPGQGSDGWSVGATRTIAAAADSVFDAITDRRLMEGWLPGAQMQLRTSTRPRSARYDWEDGSTRVVFYTRQVRMGVYMAKAPMSDELPPGNPATFYCAALSGSSQFGLSGAGGGWVDTDGAADPVVALCVFPDGSAIDDWGIAYASAGTVRGADLSELLRTDISQLPPIFG